MRILHTSDLHIGRTLYGRKRYEEFDAFLQWLANTIQEESVEVLIIAGDVFDTSTPSNRAQELYYQFLCRIASSACQHVIVVAGNHDSPSFLEAPRELLKALNVHVVGEASENPSDHVIVLRNSNDTPNLIVCAVPYLRDRDLRVAEAGESIADKQRKIVEGIARTYANVTAAAQQKCAEFNCSIPIVATGHLFTAGGFTADGDGVRDLYVGSLAHVTASIFSESLSYVALGHLHVAQMVNGIQTIRYSGSPLPMGFGEATQQKSVCVVEICSPTAGLSNSTTSYCDSSESHSASKASFFPSTPNNFCPTTSVRTLNVPLFQELVSVRGNWEIIATKLHELVQINSSAWVEIVYDGAEIVGDLSERVSSATKNSSVTVLRILNTRVITNILQRSNEYETLDSIEPRDVFERCLNQSKVPNEQRPELRLAYQEVISSLQQCDSNAE